MQLCVASGHISLVQGAAVLGLSIDCAMIGLAHLSHGLLDAFAVVKTGLIRLDS